MIAYGMAKNENDEHAAPVFERADKDMVEKKAALKTAQSDS